MTTKTLLALIDDYGRACRRDGNPAWESAEGRALAAVLAATAAPAEPSDAQIEDIWNALDGSAIIQNEQQIDWNRAMRRVFARNVLKHGRDNDPT